MWLAVKAVELEIQKIEAAYCQCLMVDVAGCEGR